ncbi:MAG: VWA domain-containing protein, partial [Microvirga sp.]
MIDGSARQGEGRLADNIAYFARALRAAGLPVGPGAVLDAIAAVEAARIGPREDFYWTLHAVFVKRHEHSILFDQAFRTFWRRRALIEKLIAQMSPIAAGGAKEEKKPQAGALRVAEALASPRQEKPEPVEKTEFSARLTVSDREVLKAKDFAQMSAAEIAGAKRLIADMSLPDDEVITRRFVSDPRGRQIDPRRTFRRSLRGGGAAIDLA